MQKPEKKDPRLELIEEVLRTLLCAPYGTKVAQLEAIVCPDLLKLEAHFSDLVRALPCLVYRDHTHLAEVLPDGFDGLLRIAPVSELKVRTRLEEMAIGVWDAMKAEGGELWN